MARQRGRSVRSVAALLAAALVLPVVTLPASPAGAATVTVPSEVVIEWTTALATPVIDPNRCVVAVFVQFTAHPSEQFGTTYQLTIPDHLLGGVYTEHGGPGTNTFVDSYTTSGNGVSVTWTAPEGTHRFFLGSGSTGAGCAGALADTQARWRDPVVTVDVHLTASFEVTPRGAGEFELLATAEGGTEPYSYTWDDGNGTSEEGGRLTSVRYTAPGSYVVTLTVFDGEGEWVVATQRVQVDAPALDVTVDHASPGGSLRLGEPTDIVVKVAAGSGVGRLTDLTFVDGVLRSIPEGAVDIVAGPTPTPPPWFELDPDTSLSFVVTVVPRLPVRITLRSDVTG